MATLISQVTSCGQRRRCDSRCYNAKRKRCECICGGRNHGVGFEQALANTREFVAETVAQQGLELVQGDDNKWWLATRRGDEAWQR